MLGWLKNLDDFIISVYHRREGGVVLPRKRLFRSNAIMTVASMAAGEDGRCEGVPAADLKVSDLTGPVVERGSLTRALLEMAKALEEQILAFEPGVIPAEHLRCRFRESRASAQSILAAFSGPEGSGRPIVVPRKQ